MLLSLLLWFRGKFMSSVDSNESKVDHIILTEDTRFPHHEQIKELKTLKLDHMLGDLLLMEGTNRPLSSTGGPRLIHIIGTTHCTRQLNLIEAADG